MHSIIDDFYRSCNLGMCGNMIIIYCNRILIDRPPIESISLHNIEYFTIFYDKVSQIRPDFYRPFHNELRGGPFMPIGINVIDSNISNIPHINICCFGGDYPSQSAYIDVSYYQI